MSKIQKIVLNSARDVPFNQLILSQSNVRKIKAGMSIDELSEDVARRGLIQSLNVRPVLDTDGVETGMFEVPAGGRRYRAVERLVKQKRLPRTVPVPCVVKSVDSTTSAEEDSLAENIQRAPLHPLDQFRAFLTFREKGRSEEEIAAHHFVAVAVVKQRLRLAAVSPRLLDLYADDAMTLDQLMAFTVNGDHERQEQVFERLAQSLSKEPHVIRRMLTEGSARASDKRAQFVGLDAYTEAGGVILHDLFQGDDGGWLQDVSLLDKMVSETLNKQADRVRAEGWRWIEIAPDFGYGHTYGLRQLRGESATLTDEEQTTRDALQAEMDAIEAEFADAEELSEEADQRLGEIETAIEALDHRPVAFDPAEQSRAGAFVSIDGSGNLRIERGYVRSEDELPIKADDDAEPVENRTVAASSEPNGHVAISGVDDAPEPEEDEGLKPIPDRLMTELTAHRTLALRHALGGHPEVAFMAALHALTLRIFYRYAQDTCLELDLKSAGFGAQAPGLTDSALAATCDDRHQAWMAALPKETEDLWDALIAFDSDSRQALFAHCVSLSVNAIYEPHNRKPRALTHADRLAKDLDLDMVAAGWTPTVETYLGRVTKARILAAVREARGEQAGDRIEHLKKGEMAGQAQALLDGSGWLPEPLRTPGPAAIVVVDVEQVSAVEPDHDTAEDTVDKAAELIDTDDGEDDLDAPIGVDAAHAIAAE